MNQPVSRATARRLLAELDAEMAQLDERLAERQQQHRTLAELRAIWEPYMRQNPNLTVREAIALDRRERPWAYRRAN